MTVSHSPLTTAVLNTLIFPRKFSSTAETKMAANPSQGDSNILDFKLSPCYEML
jgi:hypothetical protein